MSHVSWNCRIIQNLKGNWLVVSKLTWEIWQILAHALKSLKNLHFNGLLLIKVYNVWAKKSSEELPSMTLKSDTKFEEKLTCGLENDSRNLAHFHQSTLKCQNVTLKGFPANICWFWRRPQDYFSSSKTSWRRLANTSWRRHGDVLEEEKFLRWRRLEDMSWRRLENILEMTKYLLGISVSNHGLLTNLNQYLTNPANLTNLYFTNLKWIENILRERRQLVFVTLNDNLWLFVGGWV